MASLTVIRPNLGDPLPATIDEDFAQLVARTGNASAAWRELHPESIANNNTVSRRAHELRHRPDIAARIQQLHQQALTSGAADFDETILAMRAIAQDAHADARSMRDAPKCSACGNRGYGDPRLYIAAGQALTTVARMAGHLVDRRTVDARIRVEQGPPLDLTRLGAAEIEAYRYLTLKAQGEDPGDVPPSLLLEEHRATLLPPPGG